MTVTLSPSDSRYSGYSSAKISSPNEKRLKLAR